MVNYSKMSDDDLIQCHANAQKTGDSARGHGKTDRNRHLESVYLAEIERRNLTPAKPYTIGVFNGEGAA